MSKRNVCLTFYSRVEVALPDVADLGARPLRKLALYQPDFGFQLPKTPAGFGVGLPPLGLHISKLPRQFFDLWHYGTSQRCTRTSMI